MQRSFEVKTYYRLSLMMQRFITLTSSTLTRANTVYKMAALLQNMSQIL